MLDTQAVQACARRSARWTLFNCAGHVHAGNILECPESDWDFAMDLNAKSMHRTIRAFLPAMLERGGGSIINMSSAASSVKGVPNRYAYGASKAAVIGLTKAVAADFVARGIRCNAICPGTIESPSLRDRIATQARQAGTDDATVRAAFVARQPIGRVGRAEKSRRWRSTWPATNPPSPPAPSRSSTAAGPTDAAAFLPQTSRTRLPAPFSTLSFRDPLSSLPYSGARMKLVRYGQPGQEKPGLIDAQGRAARPVRRGRRHRRRRAGA